MSITVKNHMGVSYEVLRGSEITKEKANSSYCITLAYSWRDKFDTDIITFVGGMLHGINKDGTYKGYNTFEPEDLIKIYEYLKDEW